MNKSCLFLTFLLVLALALPACAESAPNLTLTDVFMQMFPSTKILGKSDDYIIIAVDYEELNSGSSSSNDIIPDNLTVYQTILGPIPYKVVILFAMQGDAPVVCAYIPINEDGTFPKGGMIGDPGVNATALISPAFMFQHMTLTPTTPLPKAP